jgi:site-specific DNA recombinase
LYRLLTNVTYLGKVTHKDAVYDGEHPAIVDTGVFDRVHSILKRNGATGGAPVRNKFGALLGGLIQCAPCGCAMSPTHTTRKGNRRYRYYVCSLAQKRGWDTCPSKSIPAAQVEGFVVEQIKCIGRDPVLRADVVAQARRLVEAQTSELDRELKGLEKELATAQAELRKAALELQTTSDAAGAVAKLAGLHERIRLAEARLDEVSHRLQVTKRNAIDETRASAALAAFDPVWAALGPREQERVIHLLVGRVEYDGAKETITVAFNPTGIRTLTDELAQQSQGRTA